MARHESDREDLFAELAALSPRIELRTLGSGQTVCAGRRESTGSWSIYLSPDRVYHFDSAGGLRRAYIDGSLYRSEGTTLSQLHRERSETETVLRRQDLGPEELSRFLGEMHDHLTRFRLLIASNQLEVLRSSPPESPVISQLDQALEQVLHADRPLSPAIRA
ncbi:MAG TPA: hypothetical protein VM452_11825 [Caulifigura sp.]|nr:hypothetical protein [Caulifigura sp.]